MKLKKGYILLPLAGGICIIIFFHWSKGWLTLPQAIASMVFFTFLLVAIIEALSILKKILAGISIKPKKEIPPYLQKQKVAKREQKLFPRPKKRGYEFSLRSVVSP